MLRSVVGRNDEYVLKVMVLDLTLELLDLTLELMVLDLTLELLRPFRFNWN